MMIYRYDDYGLECNFFFSVLPSSSAGMVTARMSPLSKNFFLALFIDVEPPALPKLAGCRVLRLT